MSHINYLPLKRPFQRAIEVRDKSLLWPSAVSLALHLPFILAIIAIGNMRPQLGDNMGTAAIWIPTALLQQEALAASKPESLSSSDYQEEPELEDEIPDSPKTDTPPIDMAVASTLHYPEKKPPAAGRKWDSAKKGIIDSPMANDQVVLGKFSSAAPPSKPQLAPQPQMKSPPRQELVNNGGKIPVVPTHQTSKEESKLPSTFPVSIVAPRQMVRQNSTADRPAPTTKVNGAITPYRMAKASTSVTSATAVTGKIDRNRPERVNQAVQQQPAHAKPAEQTLKSTEPALHIPLKTSAAAMPQPVGIFDAPLNGDLRLEVTGGTLVGKNIKMVVLFRQYPKKRHQRPMSATEAKRVKTLTPRMARLRDTAVQFAVETAPDGIYEFRVQGDLSVEGNCVITIMTEDKKKVMRNLGTKKLSSFPIVKILMPEGLVWENDTAFTGSMEDSESITKYNADTGLTWKEYKTSEN